MHFIEIIGIGIGLSMDALAVSITNGFVIKDIQVKHALRIALFFGVFQAIMPVIGWATGLTLSRYIEAFDHWVAFVLLAFIGGKMILESRRKEEPGCEEEKKNCLHVPTLLLMSLATSIDALAVGLSFAFLNVSILFPVAIIGSITFCLCVGGVYVGKKIGHLFKDKLELVGGIVLIGIGLKILIEHLVRG